eukprot:6947958-Prymnesium_polylepis.1
MGAPRGDVGKHVPSHRCNVVHATHERLRVGTGIGIGGLAVAPLVWQFSCSIKRNDKKRLYFRILARTPECPENGAGLCGRRRAEAARRQTREAAAPYGHASWRLAYPVSIQPQRHDLRGRSGALPLVNAARDARELRLRRGENTAGVVQP